MTRRKWHWIRFHLILKSFLHIQGKLVYLQLLHVACSIYFVFGWWGMQSKPQLANKHKNRKHAWIVGSLKFGSFYRWSTVHAVETESRTWNRFRRLNPLFFFFIISHVSRNVHINYYVGTWYTHYTLYTEATNDNKALTILWLVYTQSDQSRNVKSQ